MSSIRSREFSRALQKLETWNLKTFFWNFCILLSYTFWRVLEINLFNTKYRRKWKKNLLQSSISATSKPMKDCQLLNENVLLSHADIDLDCLDCLPSRIWRSLRSKYLNWIYEIWPRGYFVDYFAEVEEPRWGTERQMYAD